MALTDPDAVAHAVTYLRELAAGIEAGNLAIERFDMERGVFEATSFGGESRFYPDGTRCLDIRTRGHQR